MSPWFQRDEEIRGLSLTALWAWLIAIEAKNIETRSWSTPYRGLIAIHASKTFPKVCRALCWRDPFRSALMEGGFDGNDDHLPVGCIGAVCRLDTILETERILEGWSRQIGRRSDAAAWAARETAFGDFSPDRYGWFLKDVVRLKTPVPATGALGLWTFDKQPEALAEIRRQLREAA